MALTKVSRGLLTTSIVDNGNATAITIDSNENVGIGRSPRVMLDVAGEAAIAYNANYGLRFYNQDQNNWSSIGNNVATGSSSATLVFKDAGGEAMRLDGSRNLLVGKSALEYENTAGHIFRNDGLQSSIRSGGNVADFNRLSSDGEVIRLSKDGTTVGSIGAQSGRLTVGSNSAAGVRFDGTQLVPMNGASISDNTITLGDSGFRFKDLHLSGTANIGNLLNITDGVTNGFLTTTSGLMQFGTSTSAPIVFYTGNAERVRLHTSGKTVASASISFDFIHYFQQTNANGYMLGVDTAGSALAFFYKNGSTGVGSITTNGTSTSFNETSDKRAKENIVDSPSASADIDSIQVRSFDWIETGESARTGEQHQKYGTIAQELQSIAPYAVYEPENSENMMGVDYSKLVPMMLKEIQSLRTRVQELENT